MTPQPPYCSRVGCPNQPTHAAGGNRWCRKHLPLDGIETVVDDNQTTEVTTMSDSTTDVMCSDCERSFTVYEDEVRAFYRFHRCWPPPERAILSDLIGDLRARAEFYGPATRLMLEALADRASRRLLEVAVVSDNWVQCPICGGDVGDEAVADYDRAAYETGVQDSMPRATQYERILLDLIAELRDTHRPFDSADDCCPDCAGICESCADEAPCRSARAADRAEARLREVTGE